MPEASQGLNVARLASLRAGFPVEVPSATINRFCSSGLQTVALAAQQIMTDMADVVIAGGVEMMSQVPMSGYYTRLAPELTESYIGMGFTAERVAERWKVSREDQDRWALGSQQKAAKAWQEGKFARQIAHVPVAKTTWKGARKEEHTSQFGRDELIRADTTLDGLAKLKPAFKVKGTVTAGNSSPYSDGAAALVLMSRARAKDLGIKPLARFITFAASGVEPDIMGIAPVKAVPKALKRAKMSMKDIDLIEFNEAFAAQVVAVVRELGMPEDCVNVNGGAIALGHPLGATGSKLTTQLIHELGARGGGVGLVTMCIGGGMGGAGLFEVYAA
jgi:acetyl-CoA acyltransferase